MRPLTLTTPKELLPLGRRLVLQVVLAELATAGVRRVLIIVSPQKPQIQAALGSSWREEGGECVELEYAVQPEPRGSGDAVLRAEEWAAGEPVVVAFGDCVIAAGSAEPPLLRMQRCYSANGAGAVVLVEVVPAEHVSRYGIVRPMDVVSAADPFLLSGLVEKPMPLEAPSNFAVSARFIVGPGIYTALRAQTPDFRGETNLTEAIATTAHEGPPVWAVPLRSGEERLDTGAFDGYLAAFVRHAMQDEAAGGRAREEAARLLAPGG
ncbi:MAG: NTP transferase domain-containing protein [Armatimonadetes bacterium]|nr:NTP transferase domain-containing protein [Armatimonadota bacterium]MDE2206095.1 NTP transferase domain-containing protein [Armatimonadota bacterium]